MFSRIASIAVELRANFRVALFIAFTFSLLISVEIIRVSRSAFSIVFANSMAHFSVSYLSANSLRQMLLFCKPQIKWFLKVGPINL